ncbi:MAG TPA: SMP-30/gluconolactonase/LRE family protein [Pseudaminobacter sp.]|jgi:sugar lactone lactonase YvrE|nr:SMP-30/gluconolactonase/LRE family protein [Pseudaminobacter sp.]
MHVLTPEAIPIGETKAVLGEGAFWSAEDDALLWVDILGKRVFRTRPDSGRTEEWSFPEQTAFVQPADDGTWLIGQEKGIVRLDPATGRTEDFLAIEADDPTTRTNDAGCDRQGRLFVGTMRIPDFGLEPVGSLYRIASRGPAETVDTGLTIPNGIAFSPEGDIAYWADTYMTKRQVWRAGYDAATGRVHEKQAFVQLPEALGRPDGAAVDADGCYWVAAVWGWQLLRYTPHGELDLAVHLPVQRPSKLAFGGPDLKTIYVTSISDGLGDDAPKTQPLAGRLLAINLGIQGLPAVRFRLAGT